MIALVNENWNKISFTRDSAIQDGDWRPYLFLSIILNFWPFVVSWHVIPLIISPSDVDNVSCTKTRENTKSRMTGLLYIFMSKLHIVALTTHLGSFDTDNWNTKSFKISRNSKWWTWVYITYCRRKIDYISFLNKIFLRIVLSTQIVIDAGERGVSWATLHGIRYI